MSTKPISSPYVRERAGARLETRSSRREFERLRHEAQLLCREAKQVRSQTHELAAQLHAVCADFHKMRERLAAQGIRPDYRQNAVLSIVTAVDKRLPQDESLRQLSGSLMAAIEEERSRIARELHDDLNQNVAWLQLKVATLRDGLSGTPPDECDAALHMLAEGLNDLSAKITQISRELHPAILRDLGLEAAMRSYVVNFSQQKGIEAVFRASCVPHETPPQVGISLYRILQEALHNVSKHAKAQRVVVALSAIPGTSLRLLIRDNGIGMPANPRSRGRGLGMISMEERARLVQGKVTVRSQTGKGTQVTVLVPLTAPPVPAAVGLGEAALLNSGK